MDFAAIIEAWYLENKRVLPWRSTKDAYKIWLSEVILQQTRVDQGLPYYLKFIESFPQLKDLAQAKEEKVLKLWQGLGYYSRAKNLHLTAKIVLKEYNGIFPKEYKKLILLKGIGDYSASAISSFSRNEKHAVVDGNVYRVLSRVFNVSLAIESTEGKKYFKELATELLDKKNPGLFNQAIMEFGAMQCVPKNPNCEKCPLQLHCEARIKKTISSLPVKSKKTKVKKVYFYYLIIKSGNKYYLRKRDSASIWKNLYDFPSIETDKLLSKNEEYTKIISLLKNKKIQLEKWPTVYTHQLSHRTIEARFYITNLPKFLPETKDLVSSKWFEMPKFPIPKLIDRFLVDKFELK